MRLRRRNLMEAGRNSDRLWCLGRLALHGRLENGWRWVR